MRLFSCLFPPQSAPIKPAGQSGRNYKYRRKAMNPERSTPTPRHDRADLQEHYGEIGISAVAAAVRYQSDARNPAYAPVAPDPEAHAKIAEQAIS